MERLFGNPSYGLTRRLENISFGDAIAAITQALADEGFGILTEIDVSATLNKKLGVEFQKYVILGACNPKLAHRALTHEPGVGLLLPCNVVVADDGLGGVAVSVIDPKRMFALVARDDIAPIAAEARESLSRALAAL